MSNQKEDKYLTVIKNRKGVWGERTYPEVFMSSKNHQQKVKNVSKCYEMLLMIMKNIWYLKAMNMMIVMKESDNSSSDIKSLVKKVFLVMNILLLLFRFQLQDTQK